jgi:hypothetical protein
MAYLSDIMLMVSKQIEFFTAKVTAVKSENIVTCFVTPNVFVVPGLAFTPHNPNVSRIRTRAHISFFRFQDGLAVKFGWIIMI